MANTINLSYQMKYKSFESTLKTTSSSNGSTKQAAAQYKEISASFDVNFSAEGLAALAESKKDSPVTGIEQKESENQAKIGDEDKLSDKAKDFLGKLREKYGDYDFFVAEKIGDPQEYMNQSSKAYTVILTNDELERMANDEEYADKIMGKVDSAVDMTKRIESNGQLGEGVQLKQIAISFDNEGNMKLFAQLEKMSEEQQERLKEAQEKRAEEQKEEDDEKPDRLGSPQTVNLEATSEEELLEKILNIDWNALSQKDQEEEEFPWTLVKNTMA